MHFCSQPALLGQKLQFLIFQRITENIPYGMGRTAISASARPSSRGHSTNHCRISSGFSSVPAGFGSVIVLSSIGGRGKNHALQQGHKLRRFPSSPLLFLSTLVI